MSRMPGKKVIGLTGTIGSGKSTALRIMSEYMPANDCDQITASLLKPQSAGYEALKEQDLLITDENGDLDRKKTAAKLFSDPEYKKKYEGILHPLILQAMNDWIAAQDKSCVVEVPLLFELGLQEDFDETWMISASQDSALKRTEENRNISRNEQLERRSFQMPDEKKAELADVLIFNDGTLSDLTCRLCELISERILPDPDARIKTDCGKAV